MSNRAQFVTKMGVIAATVGSAVGLGNIWRFPYEAGQHGGGAFLIIYLLCVCLLGIPVMIAEFVIGRSTHSNALTALQKLRPGSRMSMVSYVGIVASLMILSFYSVVAGWIMEYLYQAITGGLSGHTAEEYAALFGTFTVNPWRSVMWTLLFLSINFMVLRRGVEKGIERLSNVLMPVLFVILVVFCVNSLMMPRATEGLNFLFNPDFSALTPKVMLGALGQAFFSLSLGLTCLLTYASYFSDRTPLVRSATVVAVLDTLVAILSGIIIFPAVFSFGMEPAAGPKLVFQILPEIFQQLPGGYLWSVAFFLLLFFASITSTISMSEISITYFVEAHKMSRNRATGLNTAIAAAFGTLCALSFGVLSEWTVAGMTLFELFDYVSSNVLLPVGGVMLSVFVGWMADRKVVEEQLTDYGARRITLLLPIRFCIRYVAPVCITLIFLYGIGVL
ncbi:MAG: sodium-dependent transporter [Bacteroidales bacterium]|nr:sodium-dependent transporter [Bacteroidales bacterium]